MIIVFHVAVGHVAVGMIVASLFYLLTPKVFKNVIGPPAFGEVLTLVLLWPIIILVATIDWVLDEKKL